MEGNQAWKLKTGGGDRAWEAKALEMTDWKSLSGQESGEGQILLISQANAGGICCVAASCTDASGFVFVSHGGTHPGKLRAA